MKFVRVEEKLFIRFNGCFLFLFSLFLITLFICLFKERKSELGRGFGAINNYWIEQMQWK